MMRWARTGTIVASMVWTGFLSAQASNAVTPVSGQTHHPAPAAKDGIRDGEVLVLNSAGQPTRRLQVLKISSIPDGPTLVDVKDLESGGIYTLPAQALAAARRDVAPSRNSVTPPTPQPTTVVASKPVDAPVEAQPTREWKPSASVAQAHSPAQYQSSYPATATAPQTQPATSPAFAQPVRPTYASANAPTVATPEATSTHGSSPPRATASTLPQAFMRNPVSARVSGGWPQLDRSSAPSWPRSGALPSQTVASGPVYADAHALPRFDTNRMPQQHYMPQARPQPAMQMVQNATPAVTYHPMPVWQQRPVHYAPADTVAAIQTPTAPEAISDPVPTPPASPSVMMPPASLMVATPEQRTPTVKSPTLVANAQTVPGNISAHWQATAATPSNVQPVSLSVPTRTERWIAADPQSRMVAEIQPWMNDLASAIRPSVRETAATALAEGRYGSRSEVKAVLAKTAMTDPADSVQAHCIRLLSQLGYHEVEYLNYLRATAYSGLPEAKSAATAALARLAPR